MPGQSLEKGVSGSSVTEYLSACKKLNGPLMFQGGIGDR